MPVMEQHTIEALGMNISYPYLWDLTEDSAEDMLSFCLNSRYDDDNIWDMSVLYIGAYTNEEDIDLQMIKELYAQGGYDVSEVEVNGLPAMKAVGQMENNSGNVFNDTLIMMQKDDVMVTFEFYIHEDFGDDANPLFDAIMNSVSFTQ